MELFFSCKQRGRKKKGMAGETSAATVQFDVLTRTERAAVTRAASTKRRHMQRSDRDRIAGLLRRVPMPVNPRGTAIIDATVGRRTRAEQLRRKFCSPHKSAKTAALWVSSRYFFDRVSPSEKPKAEARHLLAVRELKTRKPGALVAWLSPRTHCLYPRSVPDRTAKYLASFVDRLGTERDPLDAIADIGLRLGRCPLCRKTLFPLGEAHCGYGLECAARFVSSIEHLSAGDGFDQLKKKG